VKSLSTTGVTKSFGGPAVLSGVDLDVPEGSFTAILGASGSGKTTLLRIIAGFERPDAGQVRLGAEVVDDAAHRFVPCEKRRIGYVPQEGALFPHLSVGRNVAFGLSRQERRSKRVDELLELVGLAGLARRYPHELSGGQQQRVALARALASEPEVVLLDEPFSSLDASLRASVRADVHGVLRLSGATSILVTHDQDEALSMADQVAILRGGVIAQINSPTALYSSPRDAELAQFLGEANMVEGTVRGGRVTTALGLLDIAPGCGNGNGPGSGSGPGTSAGTSDQRVSVMVRPEQLQLGDVEASAITSIVRSYEYFGHDAVVRVQPDNGGLPELVVRITGGPPMVPGTRVGLTVHGDVVVWPWSDGTGAGERGERAERAGSDQGIGAA
jgi:iron(III) transport system ATP-binding protein